MKPNPHGWHILHVKFCHKGRVPALLQKKSFESSLSLVETRKQWSDRKEQVVCHYSLHTFL